MIDRVMTLRRHQHRGGGQGEGYWTLNSVRLCKSWDESLNDLFSLAVQDLTIRVSDRPIFGGYRFYIHSAVYKGAPCWSNMLREYGHPEDPYVCLTGWTKLMLHPFVTQVWIKEVEDV